MSACVGVTDTTRESGVGSLSIREKRKLLQRPPKAIHWSHQQRCTYQQSLGDKLPCARSGVHIYACFFETPAQSVAPPRVASSKHVFEVLRF